MSGSYPIWPFSCPRAWVRNPKPSLIRSNVEDGYPKVRRRFTKAWDEYQAQWMMDWLDEPNVMAFFTQDCQDGASPFYIDDPYTHQQILVRWKEPPTISGSADTKPVIQVSGTLERVFS
jgi:hypothetical protein